MEEIITLIIKVDLSLINKKRREVSRHLLFLIALYFTRFLLPTHRAAASGTHAAAISAQIHVPDQPAKL